MSYSIEIKGLKELQNNFKKSPVMVTKELVGAIKTSIHIIRPMMVKEAPHDTGELRKNIYARQIGLTGTVGPDLNKTPYALYVNYGTSPYIIRNGWGKGILINHPGIKANPFMQRTVDEMTPIVQKIFEKTISNIINKLAK